MGDPNSVNITYSSTSQPTHDAQAHTYHKRNHHNPYRSSYPKHRRKAISNSYNHNTPSNRKRDSLNDRHFGRYA
jgi:hypothetical protein